MGSNQVTNVIPFKRCAHTSSEHPNQGGCSICHSSLDKFTMMDFNLYDALDNIKKRKIDNLLSIYTFKDGMFDDKMKDYVITRHIPRIVFDNLYHFSISHMKSYGTVIFNGDGYNMDTENELKSNVDLGFAMFNRYGFEPSIRAEILRSHNIAKHSLMEMVHHPCEYTHVCNHCHTSRIRYNNTFMENACLPIYNMAISTLSCDNGKDNDYVPMIKMMSAICTSGLLDSLYPYNEQIDVTSMYSNITFRTHVINDQLLFNLADNFKSPTLSFILKDCYTTPNIPFIKNDEYLFTCRTVKHIRNKITDLLNKGNAWMVDLGKLCRDIRQHPRYNRANSKYNFAYTYSTLMLLKYSMVTSTNYDAENYRYRNSFTPRFYETKSEKDFPDLDSYRDYVVKVHRMEDFCDLMREININAPTGYECISTLMADDHTNLYCHYTINDVSAMSIMAYLQKTVNTSLNEHDDSFILGYIKASPIQLLAVHDDCNLYN